MRAGLAVSTIAHAALIALIVIGVGFSRPLEPTPVESIAVDLVPIEEFSNIRAGSLESEVVETETPSVVEDVKPAELAQPTGNTEQDQPTPEDTPTPTPAPTQQTAPEPVPAPEPVEEPAPEPEPVPTPVEPMPRPEPEPVPEPEPEPVEEAPALATPQVSPEPAEVAPRPVMRTASLDQKRAAFKQQQEAEKKRKEEEARKRQQEAKRAEEAKRQQDEAARRADDISDIINAEESRGATTGAGGTPTLGKPTGQAARLSQSETDALVAQMRSCWNLLPAEIDSGLSVRLLVELNPDGSVAGAPRVLEQDSSAVGISIARAAVNAVRKCGPYRLAAEKYEAWRQVDVTFRAGDL